MTTSVSITVAIMGHGNLNVFRNGKLIGSHSTGNTTKDFIFDVGDEFTFSAEGRDGWKFYQFCESYNCKTPYNRPDMSGKITQRGNLIVRFIAPTTTDPVTPKPAPDVVPDVVTERLNQ